MLPFCLTSEYRETHFLSNLFEPNGSDICWKQGNPARKRYFHFEYICTSKHFIP